MSLNNANLDPGHNWLKKRRIKSFMLLTLCFLPSSMQIQKMHMDFVCPQNEWFQRDCKLLRGGGGEYVLVIGKWGCVAGWGCILTTGLTIMGLHFYQSY